MMITVDLTLPTTHETHAKLGGSHPCPCSKCYRRLPREERDRLKSEIGR